MAFQRDMNRKEMNRKEMICDEFFAESSMKTGGKLPVDTFQGRDGCLQLLNLLCLRCLSKRISVLRRTWYDFGR